MSPSDTVVYIDFCFSLNGAQLCFAPYPKMTYTTDGISGFYHKVNISAAALDAQPPPLAITAKQQGVKKRNIVVTTGAEND